MRCPNLHLQSTRPLPLRDQAPGTFASVFACPQYLLSPNSVLLISPQNEILLLHRVRNSSSFASAHVFPGGNLEAFHDGAVPTPEDPARHEDGEAYRLAAIRETFEESGILLAKNAGFGRLIEVQDDEREEGRKAIHSGEAEFRKWLAAKGGRPDTGTFTAVLYSGLHRGTMC